MDEELRTRLEQLRAEYATVVGQPFTHFFCPLLFLDDDVEVCKAHIVNKAFGASGAWTVQRKDIDGFYGTMFEADFTLLRHRAASALDVLGNPALSRAIKPAVMLDGERVGHIGRHSTDFPDEFTPIELQQGTNAVPLTLKMSREAIHGAARAHWEIDFRKDLRLPTLISAIKAAHLTLFAMLGYSYALTAGGALIGHNLLGKFFLDHRDQPRDDVARSATEVFREFQYIVKPIASCQEELQGTITDRTFVACHSTSGPFWALIVFVHTGKQIFAVMVPSTAATIGTYLEFCRNDTKMLTATACVFDPSKQAFIGKPGAERFEMQWSKDSSPLEAMDVEAP